MLNYLICGLVLLLRVFSSLFCINNTNSHKRMSASRLFKDLSNKRITRQHFRHKPSCNTLNLRVKVSESDQTHTEDYRVLLQKS